MVEQRLDIYTRAAQRAGTSNEAASDTIDCRNPSQTSVGAAKLPYMAISRAITHKSRSVKRPSPGYRARNHAEDAKSGNFSRGSRMFGGQWSGGCCYVFGNTLENKQCQTHRAVKIFALASSSMLISDQTSFRHAVSEASLIHCVSDGGDDCIIIHTVGTHSSWVMNIIYNGS